MIAHVDADSFFASVLQRLHPELRGKPLLAMGMGGGCVIAASYEAKAFGVKTGMRLGDALKLCPQALRMDSDFRETMVASNQIEHILQNTCPVIEETSIDEWYLDLTSLVGGIPQHPEQWARDLQATILTRTSLSVSIGVSLSKLLAKMAGEYRKPAGVSVVLKDGIKAFLHDRQAAAIPGIGRQRSKDVALQGWSTAWDIASAHTGLLKELFGKGGPELQRELLGESLSPVATSAEPQKSISRARSFRPIADRAFVWAHVLRHLSYTVLKMRRHGLAARGISVWLRDGDYKMDGTYRALPRAFETEEELTPFARSCFEDLFSPRMRYTQVGIALAPLMPAGVTQYPLFTDPAAVDRREDLQQALDAVRSRYGRDVISRGSAVQVNEEKRPELEFSIID